MSPKLVIKHDPQQKAVYNWQWEWMHWNSKELSKKDVYRWVKWAYKKKFHFKFMPEIVHLADGGSSSYHPEKNQLKFIHSHRNIAVVLHETAHLIISRLFGHTVEDHGPEFMGIWIYLLEKAKLAPRGTIYDSAKQAGLRVDGSMGPELLKKKGR